MVLKFYKFYYMGLSKIKKKNKFEKIIYNFSKYF